MKQLNNLKTIFLIVAAVLLASLMSSSWATGPRVTKALLSPNENQIYTHDFPPFSTTDLAGGGFSAEIIDAVLKLINIDAVQTILPLQSMVKFYLIQEKSLAVYGRNLIFSQKEKESLIYIPLAVSSEHYFYYKPAYKSGLSWDGKLTSFKGLTYGAYKGEATHQYKNAHIQVEHGRVHSLLKKIISRKIDFITLSDLNMAWMLDNHFPNERNNFVTIENSSKANPVFMVFNKKHAQGNLMAKKFNEGLTRIIANGRYLKIMEKYLPEKNAQDEYMAMLDKFRRKHQ